MAQDNVFRFQELKEQAQQVALEQLHEYGNYGPTKDLLEGDITKWVQERTGQETLEIEWVGDSLHRAKIYSMDAQVSRDDAYQHMTKRDTEAIEKMRVLPFGTLYENLYEDMDWQSTFEIDPNDEVTEKDVQKWFQFLLEHKKVLPVDFNQQVKEIRFQMRLRGENEYGEMMGRYLIRVLENRCDPLLRKLDEGYVKAYKMIREEAVSYLEERIEYYESDAYLIDVLHDQRGSHHRFKEDGALLTCTNIL